MLFYAKYDKIERGNPFDFISGKEPSMKRSIFAVIAAAVLGASCFAFPAEAVDLSYAAAEYTYVTEYTAPPDLDTGLLTDGMESTALKFSAGDTLRLKCEAAIGGIYIKFDLNQTKWCASVGETAIQFGTNGFLHEYAPCVS